MSSKQQLMDYNKRLKKTIEDKNKIIASQGIMITKLQRDIKLAKSVVRTKKSWWNRIFNKQS